MKSGFVSIIGRPNVGKSTLLNSVLEAKVAITSDKSGTTRNVIQGIYNDEDSQMIFVDTPGIHKPVHKLGKVLNKSATSLIREVDLILFLVDAKDGLGPGDKFIIEKFKSVDIPVILVINKIDLISKEMLMSRVAAYKDLFNFAEIVPVSAETDENVTTLLNVIKGYMPHNNKFFEGDAITTVGKKFMISEYVREKLLRLTSEEIPHSITCVVVNYEEEENIARIMVDIIVDRDAVKRIVIGKQGSLVKQVGIEARKDIEELLGKKVYLELYVKTIKKWRDKEKYFQELGFLDME